MDFSKLHWFSDYNGYEVGFPEVDVVGLYAIRDFPEILLYIDPINHRILEVWLEEEM